MSDAAMTDPTKPREFRKTGVPRSADRTVVNTISVLALSEATMATLLALVTVQGGLPKLLVAVLAATGTLYAINRAGGYDLQGLLRPRAAVIAAAKAFAALLFLTLALYWLLASLSLPFIVGSLCLTIGFILAIATIRQLFAQWLADTNVDGRLVRSVAVMTLGKPALPRAQIEAVLKGEADLGPSIHYLSVRSEDVIDAASSRNVLEQALRKPGCEEIVLVVEGVRQVMDVGRNRELLNLLEDLEMFPLRSRLLLPENPNAPDGKWQLTRVVEPPLDRRGRILKRITDIVVAAALLLLLSPLLAIIAVLVRWDSPGPIIFKQQRFGYRCELFELWKFRSMSAAQSDPDASRLTARNDPRVTSVGRWLRRTSIDELPQLVNVLKGDMSLVGPRPHPISAKAGERLYEEVIERFACRYKVRPGLTGLAQISGLRGNTDTEDKLIRRFEADLEYVRHWSYWRDIAILAKTPWASLVGDNAF